MKGTGKFFLFGAAVLSILFLAFEPSFAQTRKRKPAVKKRTATTTAKKTVDLNLPKVTQIDIVALQNLLKREGEGARPLLVNFWATWCDPCREEFPDLVKIDSEYKGKIDFITVSLDELSEINRDVPKFLAQMKAAMPAYLLKTPDEEAAIATVAKDWQGGLPFTILYDPKGVTVYTKQGKFKPEILKAELDKFSVGGDNVIQTAPFKEVNLSMNARGEVIDLPISDHRIRNLPAKIQYTFDGGRDEARRDTAEGKLIVKRYGLTTAMPVATLKKLKEKYGVEIAEHGCLIMPGFVEYARGYNEVSTAEIRRKFGDAPLKIIERE